MAEVVSCSGKHHWFPSLEQLCRSIGISHTETYTILVLLELQVYIIIPGKLLVQIQPYYRETTLTKQDIHRLLSLNVDFIKTVGKGSFGRLDLWNTNGLRLISKRSSRELNTEIDIYNRLNYHENILQMLDYHPGKEILLEYCSYGSLNLLCTHHFNYVKANKYRIAYGICRAIDFVHRHGIVHTDVSLANICLTSNHIPKLCDFGSSRPSGTHEWIGCTLPFRSPESIAQLENTYERVVQPSHDIWSLGCVLCVVLGKGINPFHCSKNDTDLELAERMVYWLGQPDCEYLLQTDLFNGEKQFDLFSLVDDMLYLNIIEACLIYKPCMRITANKCIQMMMEERAT